MIVESSENHVAWAVADYDLAATLTSGQAFRWRPLGRGWEGVIGRRWVFLEPARHGLRARSVEAVQDWSWLFHYLQSQVQLDEIIATFPGDEPMRAAVTACRGLRLLRQEPWECLASFILSSTKQITQIQQVVAQLCARFGEPIPTPAESTFHNAFPTPQRLAACSETELRACKMGFRAPRLLMAAQAVSSGQLDLEALRHRSLEEAQAILTGLPGVGPKIAQCVLLFAYGFPGAFPIDVWVERALRELYFPKRSPSPARLRDFARRHFGPHAGYAQQYLFHYMRQHAP